MENTSTFKVVDPDTGSDAWVITRVAGDTVALVLSIQENGDMEVFLPPDVALKLASALAETARTLRTP